MRVLLIAVLFCSIGLLAQEPQVDPNVPTEFDAYWFVLLKRGDNRDHTQAEAAQIQKGHLAHLGKQRRDGSLLVAGPLEVDAEHQLRGILLYPQEMPLTRVQALIAADPAVKAGRLTAEIIKWWTPKGAVVFPQVQ